MGRNGIVLLRHRNTNQPHWPAERENGSLPAGITGSTIIRSGEIRLESGFAPLLLCTSPGPQPLSLVLNLAVRSSLSLPCPFRADQRLHSLGGRG